MIRELLIDPLVNRARNPPCTTLSAGLLIWVIQWLTRKVGDPKNYSLVARKTLINDKVMETLSTKSFVFSGTIGAEYIVYATKKLWLWCDLIGAGKAAGGGGGGEVGSGMVWENRLTSDLYEV